MGRLATGRRFSLGVAQHQGFWFSHVLRVTVLAVSVFLHVHPVSAGFPQGFSSFLWPHKSMLVGGLVMPEGKPCVCMVAWDTLAWHSGCLPVTLPSVLGVEPGAAAVLIRTKQLLKTSECKPVKMPCPSDVYSQVGTWWHLGSVTVFIHTSGSLQPLTSSLCFRNARLTSKKKKKQRVPFST